MIAILGVDPGVHGALALLECQTPDSWPQLVLAQDLPLARVNGRDHLLLSDIAMTIDAVCVAYGPIHAYVEDVHAAPGQGVSSMFRFGYAAGALAGIVAAHGIDLTFLTPQRWQALVQVAKGPDAGRLRAGQLFPADASKFSRKRDHNRADAALIALAGWRFSQVHAQP